MMTPRPSLAARSVSFTAGSSLLDADGIKQSIATAATAASYSGVALNGAYAAAGIATPAPGGQTGLAQWPVATASSSAGSYINATEIVFTGTYGGAAVTRTATVVGTDGGTSFIADGPLETCTQIDVEAQQNTSGAWTFGFTDLGPAKKPERPGTPYFSGMRAGTTANVAVAYSGGYTDVIPAVAGEYLPVMPERIVGATTTAQFSVYL
jgi:hypothetical protein